MKVTVTSLEHEVFAGMNLPVEVEAFAISSAPAGLVWVAGSSLIEAGATKALTTEEGDGIDPNFLYAMQIGVHVEETPEVLQAFGLCRNDEPDGTMDA